MYVPYLKLSLKPETTVIIHYKNLKLETSIEIKITQSNLGILRR